MRAYVIVSILVIILPRAVTSAEVRTEVLDSSDVTFVPWISRAGRHDLSMKWVRLHVSSDDHQERLMSMWCLHDSRQGLSLWWPVDGDVPSRTPSIPFVLWIDRGIVGLWIPILIQPSIHVWASTTRTESLEEACEWGIRSLADSFTEIVSKLEKDSRNHMLVGHRINLERLVGNDPWLRLAGSRTNGGMAEINRIVPRKKGWLVHVKGLDRIRYGIKLDADLQLIGGKRIKP